jgi:hypothetical protein
MNRAKDYSGEANRAAAPIKASDAAIAAAGSKKEPHVDCQSCP